ncbi:unnamed protein product, partial [Ectocarpus sp. 12 AP-2014]
LVEGGVESRGSKWSEYRRGNGRNRQQLHFSLCRSASVATGCTRTYLRRGVRPTTQGYYTMSEQRESGLLYLQHKDRTFLASTFRAMSVTPCQTKIHQSYTRF